MKLLLDSCVWRIAKSELDNAGHDVVWCGDWEQDPGDEEILSHALTEQRILETLDKDFGEFAILSGKLTSAFCVLLTSLHDNRQKLANTH